MQPEERKDGRTDMMKLTVTFRNFANAPKKCHSGLNGNITFRRVLEAKIRTRLNTHFLSCWPGKTCAWTMFLIRFVNRRLDSNLFHSATLVSSCNRRFFRAKYHRIRLLFENSVSTWWKLQIPLISALHIPVIKTHTARFDIKKALEICMQIVFLWVSPDAQNKERPLDSNRISMVIFAMEMWSAICEVETEFLRII